MHNINGINSRMTQGNYQINSGYPSQTNYIGTQINNFYGGFSNSSSNLLGNSVSNYGMSSFGNYGSYGSQSSNLGNSMSNFLGVQTSIGTYPSNWTSRSNSSYGYNNNQYAGNVGGNTIFNVPTPYNNYSTTGNSYNSYNTGYNNYNTGYNNYNTGYGNYGYSYPSSSYSTGYGTGSSYPGYSGGTINNGNIPDALYSTAMNWSSYSSGLSGMNSSLGWANMLSNVIQPGYQTSIPNYTNYNWGR